MDILKRIRLILIYILVFVSQYSSAQTVIPGGVVSGVWNQAGSPYEVQGAVMIANGTTLTIDPGVMVRFQGSYKFLVLGRLLAQGTISDSITFTAADTITGWLGIRFDSTATSNDSSKFAYCKFMYGNANGNASIIDGGVLYFNHFSKVSLTNSIITKNFAQRWGGGIACYSSSPVFRNNIFMDNHADIYGGGAIYTYASNPIIMDNVFEANSVLNSVGRGGGICMYGGSNSLVTLNSFRSNIAFRGAAIFTSGTTTSPDINANSFLNNIGIVCSGVCGEFSNSIITGNTFDGNTSTVIYCEGQQPFISDNAFLNTDGGGIVCSSNCTSTIIGNTFYNGSNSAISVSNSTVTISDNFISNYSVAPPGNNENGSGIYLFGGGISTIVNNIIVNNAADSCGGAIFLNNNNSNFINNTIANNTAIYGGAFYFRNGSNPTINNTISWNNSAVFGNEIYIQDEGSDPDIYFSNFEGGSTAFGIGPNAFYLGNYISNINSDPQFVNSPTGIGTGNQSIISDWALVTTSSSLDIGNPSGTYPATDILGNPRIYNGVIDIGAIELFILGEEEIHENEDVKLFPNPTSGEFKIDLTNFTAPTVQIYNSTGRLIITGELNDEINLRNQPAGAYFVKIQQNNHIYNKLLIKY